MFNVILKIYLCFNILVLAPQVMLILVHPENYITYLTRILYLTILVLHVYGLVYKEKKFTQIFWCYIFYISLVFSIITIIKSYIQVESAILNHGIEKIILYTILFFIHEGLRIVALYLYVFKSPDIWKIEGKK